MRRTSMIARGAVLLSLGVRTSLTGMMMEVATCTMQAQSLLGIIEPHLDHQSAQSLQV